jgi:hypothetical protein
LRAARSLLAWLPTRVRAAAAAACSARDAHRGALTLHAALRLVAPQDYTILNCDDHPDYLRKHKRDPADYRPDILHQARAASQRPQMRPPRPLLGAVRGADTQPRACRRCCPSWTAR